MTEKKIKVETPAERLRKHFDSTIESGLDYCGNIEEVDCYKMICKSAAAEKLFKVCGSNTCMLNCKYTSLNSVLMIFSLPIRTNSETGVETKHVSERIMDIVKLLEDCFTVIDHMEIREVKEDKSIYIISVKKLERKKQ